MKITGNEAYNLLRSLQTAMNSEEGKKLTGTAIYAMTKTMKKLDDIAKAFSKSIALPDEVISQWKKEEKLPDQAMTFDLFKLFAEKHPDNTEYQELIAKHEACLKEEFDFNPHMISDKEQIEKIPAGVLSKIHWMID